MSQEPRGLAAWVDECFEYVTLDPTYIINPKTSTTEVYRIACNALAYIIENSEEAFFFAVKADADTVWILQETLRWAERELDNSADIRGRIYRLKEQIRIQ